MEVLEARMSSRIGICKTYENELPAVVLAESRRDWPIWRNARLCSIYFLMVVQGCPTSPALRKCLSYRDKVPLFSTYQCLVDLFPAPVDH